jgi:hypothetical protein
MVEGLLASVAADRNEFASDLLRVRDLSHFPPTLRFGVFVIFGSATAASAALFLFPWLASVSLHRKRKKVEHKGLKAA